MEANFEVYSVVHRGWKPIHVNHQTGEVHYLTDSSPPFKASARWGDSSWGDYKTRPIKKESPKESPSDRQVGGDHYKNFAIQPNKFIRKNKIGWYEGNAIKRICRHAQKGRREDIEKAIHELEFVLEEYDKGEL